MLTFADLEAHVGPVNGVDRRRREVGHDAKLFTVCSEFRRRGSGCQLRAGSKRVVSKESSNLTQSRQCPEAESREQTGRGVVILWRVLLKA